MTKTFQIDMRDALYGGQTYLVCLFKDVFQKKGAKYFTSISIPYTLLFNINMLFQFVIQNQSQTKKIASKN